MKNIIVLSRKGGNGKTTTAHALGAGLLRQGKRVLFVDMDGQANMTLTLGADENAPGAYDLLCKGLPITEAIQTTPQGDVIAGSELLHASDKFLDGVEDTFILARVLEGVKRQYDYCIIDTPAALGMVTMNCIIAANRIIVPVQADLFSVQGADRIDTTLQTLKEQCGEKRKVDGYLLTRYNPRATISKSIYNDLEQYAKDHGTKVYKTTIRECAALKEAELMQQSIFEYAPRSNGAKDYTEFINEFIG